MIYRFDFTFAEVETIIDSLCLYLNDMIDEIDVLQGDLKLYEESVAFKLYKKFKFMLQEVKDNE